MNDATRPDPDALLQRLQADAARQQRGRLKIFFGASAGVGKTCAMLAAAQQALAQGRALRVGVVETHGRADTEALAQGVPRLPLKTVAHCGHALHAFDLDAALAFAAEATQPLLLVDELAHSNAPGARHPKRWQDVQELLAAGIDVWSTMNVQHLESLNDIVAGITGVRVSETVPDRLFDEADEVVVVDLPPDELLQRLKAGKVYLERPDTAAGDTLRADHAATNFFRKGNLLALRELALRRTADRVDGQMQAYRRQGAAQPVWPNRGALLACVGPGTGAEKIVRSCARLAAQLDVPWHAVLVETPAQQALPEAVRQRSLRVLAQAQTLGASIATPTAPDAAAALVRYAREHNLSRLVLGRPARRWRPWARAPLPDRIAALADDLDVLQVALPADTRTRATAPTAPTPLRWQGYAVALAACMLTALLATPLIDVLELTNIVMLFLLVVVLVGLLHGRGPAVLAALVGVALFDLFFVPPRFSFAVTDAQYLVTLAVMLVVALVVGQLTAGLKLQARAATLREQRVRSLYDMARDLSAALLPQQVAEIGARFLRAEFGARSALLVADDHNRLQTPVQPDAGALVVDAAIAQWAFDRGEAAGPGTHTLPASPCLVLPLKAPMRVRGVLAIELAAQRMLGPDQRQLLDTCASLLAISLERIHYIDVAQQSTLQIESERLRNSLLSAISHDLRTPLTALVGLADTLLLAPTAAAQQELAQAIRQSALRMNALVGNLLDMARLEAGAVQLRRAWLPLDEVIGSAIAASAAPLHGRPVQVLLADDLPLLWLDPVLIERVFVNLFENAAKYTPAGTALAISARVVDGQVCIAVDDHGPGLPPGREEALFDKFERGQKESALPGVGLGLAISRAIVQAHGGTLRGANRTADGRIAGARFTLRLPQGEPPRDDGAAAAQA